MARLAFGVGVLRRFAVQVLDVVAQPFLGEQPGDEKARSLSRYWVHTERVLVLVDGSPRARGADQLLAARPRWSEASGTFGLVRKSIWPRLFWADHGSHSSRS